MSIQTAKQTATRLSLPRRAAFPLAAALLVMAATAPAFAEGNTATTMTPPAPNASNSSYQSENSVPENAETSTYNRPGAHIVTTHTHSPR